MPLTTDPDDPRLKSAAKEDGQNEVYLVLSEEERARGFVRPVRRSYKHVGAPGPQYPLRDLTQEQQERHAGWDYVKYEPYPESESPRTGRFWTQAMLDRVENGCGEVTTMAPALAETYARNPDFYGSTFCVNCGKHLPVNEFVWVGTSERVGS